MNLVDDARKWWKWFSTWLIAANGTFVVAYTEFQTVKDYIPERVAHYTIVTLLILTFLGRVIKQSEAQNAQPPAQ